MKRNLLVLVLLVTWSLLSISLLTPVAFAGELPASQVADQGPDRDDLIIEVNGGTDDGSGGDPGDAGDGYGITDQSTVQGNLGESSGLDNSILDEYLLILMSLIQLAL